VKRKKVHLNETFPFADDLFVITVEDSFSVISWAKGVRSSPMFSGPFFLFSSFDVSANLPPFPEYVVDFRHFREALRIR